ncbi:RNA-binding protein [Microvirga sp. W0021]|uniref:RNA-binding protein n=1 Tax=Hohaiivirga grylli TaxID=3133970 RepID=A0ABV0BGQ7_9HYPH
MLEGNKEQTVAFPDKAHGKVSERTCIVTRETLPPEKLIRFVLAPDNTVTPDLKRKLPGRGVWVKANKNIVRQAIDRKLFPKAFRAEAKAEASLDDLIDGILRQDLRQALSLANKAGCVINGSAKVEATITKRDIVALIHAQDAAPDGRRKLSQALYRCFGDDMKAIPVADLLTSDELDLALGRTHVIHAALVQGAGSDGFLKCWHRYHDYHGSEAENDHLSTEMEMGLIQPPGSERNE